MQDVLQLKLNVNLCCGAGPAGLLFTGKIELVADTALERPLDRRSP